MKTTLLKWVSLAFGGLMFVSCAEKGAGEPVKLVTQMDSLSYAFGVDIGTNLARNEVSGINSKALAQGMSDNENASSLITSEEAGKIINDFFMKKSEEKSAAAKDAASSFLIENAKKEGVNVTESGLQYEIITEGTGVIPKYEDKVKVHYHGTLLDGTVFDSSVDRGEPIEFPVGGVIKGWTEALMMMPAGSKWKLYIPSDLAYGDRGAGEKIGPGATLTFEVELLEVLPGDDAPQQ